MQSEPHRETAPLQNLDTEHKQRHLASCQSLSNESWSGKTVKHPNERKLAVHLQVVEKQIARLVEYKLRDTEAVINHWLGSDESFLKRLNALYDPSVKLSSLKAELQDYPWLKQHLLRVANLPFMKDSCETDEALIRGLNHALPFLGANAVQVIAPYALLRRSLLQPTETAFPDVSKKLHAYTLNLAGVAHQFAELTEYGNPRAAFTGGILCGISYIIIHKLFMETFQEVREANIALAQKRFNQELFQSMSQMMPQRSHLTALFDTLAEDLATRLLQWVCGQHLALGKPQSPCSDPVLQTLSPSTEHDVGSLSAVHQAIAYCNIKLLIRSKRLSEQEANQQLQGCGFETHLLIALKQERPSALNIFRRNRLNQKLKATALFQVA